MATILSCGACHYPITFRDIAPEVMAETEHTIICPMCGAVYDVLIRMSKEPERRGDDWNKEVKVKGTSIISATELRLINRRGRM